MRILVLLALLLPSLLLAQEQNDPQAKLILDKISKKIKSSDKLRIDFDFTVSFPEMEEEVFPGVLVQENEKFRTTLASQEIISNGKDLYIVMKELKTAQLNSIDGAESGRQGFVNPRDMLTIYDKGEYIYAITGEEVLGDKRVVLIEFKPIDRYSEYSKIRMAVNKDTNEAEYIKLFGKDGSRFTMTLKDIDLNPKIRINEFQYNQDDYPGVILEDLRID